EYDLTGNELGRLNIAGENLNGPIQLAVTGSELFLLHVGGATIDEFNLATGTLTTNVIPNLRPASDIAATSGFLFVTDVPDGSINEYNATTFQFTGTVATGLHGPQGI